MLDGLHDNEGEISISGRRLRKDHFKFQVVILKIYVVFRIVDF